MAGASDPAADWGRAGGSTIAAGSKPPGLRRSQAGHPPNSRPDPQKTSSALLVSGAGGQRSTFCDGSTALGR